MSFTKMTRYSRVDLLKILSDPKQRRELMIGALIATQAREGITTTREQAERAYDRIQEEKFEKYRLEK